MNSQHKDNAPIHPGKYVRLNVIPQGMTVTKAADLIGVGRPALSNFLNGKAALSQEMALRIERSFGTDRGFLLDLQARFDRRDQTIFTTIVTGRHAPTLIEIKAQRIEKWAEDIHAREDLPALLRHLSYTTGDKITYINFPAGSNSQRHGWDGEIETTVPTPWIPDGRSGWEFGCNKNPEQKANKDYGNRVQKISSRERMDTTFVFVTTRNWPSKKRWALQKSALGDWKGVRAYDADDLEQWLEQSAPTQIWFAERLNENIDGFRSPDKCWSDWSDVCEPSLSPALFPDLKNCSGVFQSWIDAQPARPFVVAGDSTAETLAFACQLVKLAGTDQDRRDASAVVFDKPQAIRRFRAVNSAPRIAIIYERDVESEIGDFYRQCHCLIVRPANDVEGEPDIMLKLPNWKEFSSGLEKMGIFGDRIEQLARASGRSPTVLRRRLSIVPAIRIPTWAEDTNAARQLIPAVLAGAWCRSTPSDCEILRQLAQTDNYSDVENTVVGLLTLQDPPLWLAGDYRGVISRIDALFGVANFVTEQDLEIFCCAAECVLSEPDPALELPEEERWAAAVHHKVRKHSSALRRGILETIVLLSVHGDRLPNTASTNLHHRVSSLINRLLTPLTLDRLLSHLDNLPHYAEAAPVTFLDIIEADLQKPEPAVFGLLKPVKSFPFSRCMRSDLLWALESLGWKYLGRVSFILAKLSSICVDDNYSNKPISSLEGLYRCWLPQTAASLEERILSLRALTERFPEIGWQVCIAQLDAGPKIAIPGHRPHWRDDYLGFDNRVTLEESHTIKFDAFKLTLSWPNHNEETLGDLVELLVGLPHDYCDKIWDQIDIWANQEANDRSKAVLRERIRRFVFLRHGLQGKNQDRARATYDRLKPYDVVVCHSWLFENYWIDPSFEVKDKDGCNYRKRVQKIRNLRISAIKEILLERGFGGIVALLKDCGAPNAVGEVLASHITKSAGRIEFLKQCLSVKGKLEGNMNYCIQGFLGSVKDTTRDILLSETTQGIDTDRIIRLFLCSPFRQHTWSQLQRHNREIRDRYWAEVNPGWNRYAEAELCEGIDRLLEAKRPRVAFFLAKTNWSKIETPQLKRLLFDITTVEVELPDSYLPESYDVSEAIHELDGRKDVHRDEMVGLELMYTEILNNSKYGIPNLERWISESPIGFVQILAMLFKRDDKKEDPPEWNRSAATNRKILSSIAHRLLARISRIPGTGESGKIDKDKLSRWIMEARHLCGEYGRTYVGDQYIGQLLARGPADEDGVRPCIPVSEAMEEIVSQDIEKGFIIESHNARGVYRRVMGEGGKQERELADRYRDWSKRRSPKYPYVGSILEKIAEDYDQKALEQDSVAKIEQRLGHSVS